MGQEYLLDTNAIIDYVGGKLPKDSMREMDVIVNKGFNICPVIKIETLGFNGDSFDMEKLHGLLSFGRLIYIDDLIIHKTIELRKASKIKLGDAIIAATALVNNLTIISRNLSDFKHIAGLNITDPHSL